jgi:hypothetical protein
MARFKKGILGGFSGTVGTVIGGSWNGIDYMRSLPTPSNAPASPAQEVQRARFSVMTAFMQSVKQLVNIGFRDYAKEMSAYNAAFSYNLRNAITGNHPDIRIDYPSVLITRGSLPNAANPSVSVTDAIISFNWTNNSGSGNAKGTDIVIAAAYCPSLKQCMYSTNAGRSSAGVTLDVSQFSSREVQTWISFISVAGDEVATSLHLGQLNV